MPTCAAPMGLMGGTAGGYWNFTLIQAGQGQGCAASSNPSAGPSQDGGCSSDVHWRLHPFTRPFGVLTDWPPVWLESHSLIVVKRIYSYTPILQYNKNCVLCNNSAGMCTKCVEMCTNLNFRGNLGQKMRFAPLFLILFFLFFAPRLSLWIVELPCQKTAL